MPPNVKETDENNNIRKENNEIKNSLKPVNRKFFANDASDSREPLIVKYKGSYYDLSMFYEVHPGGTGHIKLRRNKDITELIDKAPHPHSRQALEWLEEFKVEDKYSVHKLPRYDSEDVDWDIGMLTRIAKVKQYEKWVETPVHRPLRIFDSAILEACTHCPWYVVPIVWVPVACYSTYMCYLGFGNDLITTTIMFITGVLFWTLLEYTLHRFLFHLSAPDDGPNWRKYTQFIAHGLHHKVPFDPGRLVMPPVPCFILVTIIWNIVRLVIPLDYAYGLLGGGLVGYMGYDLMHYYLHHGNPAPNSYLWHLRQHHNRHHFESYKGEEEIKGYGITNFFWDDVFGTSMSPSDAYNGKKAKSS